MARDQANRQDAAQLGQRPIQLHAQELTITENGVAIPSRALVTTSSTQIRELLINGKHRLVINGATSLSIAPIVKGAGIGCSIHLHSGQILAQVEHDGNPFEVLGPHGRAVITGTIFDISVMKQGTSLIVAEGSVRFESSKGGVNVPAGHRSVLKAHSEPSTPSPCDARSLLAWASGNQAQHTIEEPIADSVDAHFVETLPLQLSTPGHPVALGSIDYDEWIEDKRQWFTGQFPWIMELQKGLADKGISVDYPELLIETGDIWQLVYPHRFFRKIPVIQHDSLSRIARRYDLESKQLGQYLSERRNTDFPTQEMSFGDDA